MRFILCVSFLLTSTCLAAAEDVLKLTLSIPLPHVTGRIDHMAVDREGKRLFVCALGNNTVEVIDLSEGKRIHTIIGLSEPQDAIFLPDSNRLIVSNGGDGSCRAFDGKTYKPVELLDLKSDADNLRFDPKEKKIYIGYGD